MTTRVRKLVLLLGAALAAGPLVPAPAAAASAPRARLLAAIVAGEGTALTSEPVKVGGRFDLAGLAYDGPAGVDVELRASPDGHRWTPWYHAGDGDAEGPDRSSPERRAGHVTQPVWTGQARWVQYRVASPKGAVRHLRVRAVDVQGHGESLIERLARHARGLFRGAGVPRAAAMTDQPPIVTRAEWGADEHLRRADPAYGTVRLAIVHHTVTGNDYTPAQAPALVRGIYAYHVQSNGWNDIGYNFLVDRFGTVYEGRYGGIDRAVVGAHSEGFNSVSTGVALLGTFSAATPATAMIGSLDRLLAWRLDLVHVDPQGQVTLVSKGSSRWPEGTTVTLRDISGHRDVSLTECPGDIAYGELEAIRGEVAGIGRPKLYAPAVTPPSITGTQQGGYDAATIGAAATDPLTWTLVISHFALGEIRHLTVAATTTLAASWDGTDDVGHRLPGGTYTVAIAGAAPGGQARPASITVPVDNTDEPKPVTRLAGADRFATAVAVSAQVASARSSDVVIASGDPAHLVDSLVAAPLAKVKQAPLLLTAGTALPPATSAELDRLAPTDVWVVGGTKAVSDDVATAVGAKGATVHRIAGADAPATAAEVARTMGGPRPSAMVVSRDPAHLVDGLAASGAAAGLGWPVLLVDHDTVPPATDQALRDLVSVQVWAVGGSAAIGDEVVVATHSRRIAGDDRWSTAGALADAAVGAGLPADAFVLASGTVANLVDALAGGALGRAVLLTPPAALPAVAWRTLYGQRAVVRRAWVLGGATAIGDGPPAEARHAINAG